MNMNSNGEEKINRVLKNAMPIVYEDTSQSYCRLSILKLHQSKKVMVYYPKSMSISKKAAKYYFSSFNVKIDKIIPYNSILSILQLIKHNKNYEQFIVLPDSYYPNYYRLIRRFLERSTDLCPIRFNHFGMGNNNAQYLDDWRFVEFVKKRISEFEKLYDLLYDSESKDTLIEIIRCVVEHDAYRLPQGSQTMKYWENYKHKDDECFVNCGSAKGDTVLSYLCNGYSFEKIYAFEGRKAEFHLLKGNIERVDRDIRERIILKNEYIGTSGESTNFDNRFKDTKVSLINMDIEGAEISVLEGCKELIKESRPVMAICAYHKATDLLDIPQLINKTAENYIFILRKYIGSQSPAIVNEYLYYAIPKERLL